MFTVMDGKFKFQVQDSDLEYFFLRFDKHIALSEKKPPLMLENWHLDYVSHTYIAVMSEGEKVWGDSSNGWG